MELRKYVSKSYRAPPRIKFKKILNDDLFFKRILLLKMALNKNIKINTNFRLERLKTDNNLANKEKKDEKKDDNEETIQNTELEKLIKKPNLLGELEDIIIENNKKTEKFIRSYEGIKELNRLFLTGYNDVKTPVEKRIKNFILDTVRLFHDNNIQINFRTKINKNHHKLEKENDDLNELWTQNNAATTLFKQDPFIVKGERGVYFYYVANHQGENINVKKHKYIKYLKKAKEYIEEVKDEKFSEFPSSRKKRKKMKKSNTLKTRVITKNKENENNIEKIKTYPLIKIESAKLIKDTHKSNQKNNLNIKCINNKNNSNNNSKNKKTSRNNSTQEYPSKDIVNIKVKNVNKNNNLYNNYIQNLDGLSNLSDSKTPIKRNIINFRNNNSSIKKNIYFNYENNNSNQTEEKFGEQIIKCNSNKNYSSILNIKNSFQDTNYSVNKLSSENLSNIRKNFSKINIKKNIFKMNNIGNIISRNNNDKNSNTNLDTYIKNLNLFNKSNNTFANLKNRGKKINYVTSLKHKDKDKSKLIEENENSPKKVKIEHNLTEIYERAKRNTSFFDQENIKEINDYLKGKGLKNDDIQRGMKFNSDSTFINLKEKANKLNIEARSKAFFYGIIPNKRKKKLEELREINSKISRIERQYVKALIDRDLIFIKKK